jgi:pilus assembly protein CpaE
VAFNRKFDGTTMLEIFRAGVKDFLTPPFASQSMTEMLRRVEDLRSSGPEVKAANAPIFAFLPAKAGAGATTIAVNSSLALTSTPNKRALLIDLDLNNGLVGFMMSLKSPYSVTDAAENAAEMDEALWSKIVTRVGSLDVLPAGIPKPGFRIETAQIRRILEFGERDYDAVCVDLSGMMEKYSVDVLHQVERVFLVCTPELASLHLARAKMEILRCLDLDERVSILVNRVEKSHRMIPLEEMEKVFGRKIFMTLPNAYDAARQAGIEGKPVKPASELGICFTKLAQTMLPAAAEPVVERQRNILDVFRTAKNGVAKTKVSSNLNRPVPAR